LRVSTSMAVFLSAFAAGSSSHTMCQSRNLTKSSEFVVVIARRSSFGAWHISPPGNSAPPGVDGMDASGPSHRVGDASCE
jgi:hypothetical protein